MAREAAHVHLVNDGLRSRPAKRSIAFPIVRLRIDEDALHRRGGVVTFQAGGLAAVLLWNGDGASVRIQQHLGGIKPHATRRIEGSLDAVAIELPRLHLRHEEMPIMIGPVSRGVDRNHARRPHVVFPIEEHQLHTGGASREDAEIDAAGYNCGAERGALAGAGDTLRRSWHHLPALPSSSFAASTTRSGSKPDFLRSAL